MGQTPLATVDFTLRERVMDAMKVQCLEWGTSMMDALLESKILDLFEKTKGDFNAHGMGVSCEDVPILAL
jgi:hypothetical protein